MNWKDTSILKDAHALLSPSKPSWVNYSPEKLEAYLTNQIRVSQGTRLHAFAAEGIKLAIRLPDTAASLNAFVNDAIGFKMRPEQLLFYSQNAFGTADAISFSSGMLRIHDLKTGLSPGHMTQLEIYTALFCLEQSVNPGEITIELRMYQNDEVLIWSPVDSAILKIMDIIVEHDQLIDRLKGELDVQR